MSGTYNTGLSESDVVNVEITLAPVPSSYRNFGATLILGASNVIDVSQRIRNYANLDEVTLDFGNTDPEYLAADLFFSQSPQPSILYIGRWAQNGSSAILHGAPLSATAQAALLASFPTLTTGSTEFTIDGTQQTLSDLNFSAVTNMNGAAAVINTALGSHATCVWNANYTRFDVESDSVGTSSSITYGSPSGSGTDISTSFGFTAASGATPPIDGIAAETPLTCITTLANLTNAWWASMFAEPSVGAITDSEHVAVAAFIEAASPSRCYGVTSMEAAVLDPTSDSDLASLMMAGQYTRTLTQYSSSSDFAVASFFGRMATVDFTANNSVITMKFKTEPGVTAETLTETQAATLNSKNCNVFVNYDNGTAIIQQGVMASGLFFDVRQCADWLQNQVQTDVFNLLYQSPTKIPQTDPGIHQIAVTIGNDLQDGVTNGFIAPGIWNSSLEFGTLQTGQTLNTGYYVYQPPVSSQSETDRSERIAPTIQCAIKLGGAVHSANVQIFANS